jgi:hypothetical protein
MSLEPMTKKEHGYNQRHRLTIDLEKFREHNSPKTKEKSIIICQEYWVNELVRLKKRKSEGKQKREKT